MNPLKYVELIYGDNTKDHFDSAVRIIILILIFVFDPSSITIDRCQHIIKTMATEKSIYKDYKETRFTKTNQTLQQKNKKLRIYKDLTKELGDNPDEIKLKINQIYDWNDKKLVLDFIDRK